MKATTSIFKILSVAILVAAVVYFGVQTYRYLTDPINTTVVYASSEESVMEVNGYLIREEETFHSDAGTLGHALSEGERVGKGQTMAVAYADSGALTRVERLEALKLKKEQLSFSLVSYLDPDAALKLDSSINSDILSLRRSVAGGEYGNTEEQLASLKGAILKRDYTSATQEEIEAGIKATEEEIGEMERSLNGRAITAPQSGIYSAACDGYESVLTMDFLTDDLTPGKLGSVRPRSSDNANVGKLIYGDAWYYAANITDEQAQQLEGRSTVTLRFAKGLAMDLKMTVVSLSRSENGQRTLVLRSDKYLAQTTLLRHQAATLVLRTYEGLRLPSNALRVNEEGVSGVYCVLGVRAKFKPVRVVYQGEGYALVEAASAVEDSTLLRQGDQVIVTTAQLYDGKVIG